MPSITYYNNKQKFKALDKRSPTSGLRENLRYDISYDTALFNYVLSPFYKLQQFFSVNYTRICFGPR